MDKQFPLLGQKVVLPKAAVLPPKQPQTSPVMPKAAKPGTPGTSAASAKPRAQVQTVQTREVKAAPASVTTRAVTEKPKEPMATATQTKTVTSTLKQTKPKPRYAEKVLNFLAWFIMIYVAIVIAVSVYMVISTNARISNLYSEMLYAEASTMFSSAYGATSEVLINLTGSIFGATMAELIVLMAKRVLKDEDGLTTVKKFFSKKAVSSSGTEQADPEEIKG